MMKNKQNVFVCALGQTSKNVFNIPLVLSFPFYGINIITSEKKKYKYNYLTSEFV